MNLEAQEQFKLEELLGSLTVNQLKNIRRNLDLKIKNVSSLRKQELVEALTEGIPSTVANRAMLMNVDQYTAVVTLMTKNGVLEVSQLEMEDVFYLSSVGYAHPVKKDDQQLLVMPKEIIDRFYELDPSQLKVSVNKNQKITHTLFGMMRYFGVIDLLSAQEMVKGYIEEEIDAVWFEEYVAYLSEFYGGFQLVDGYIVNELAVDVKQEILDQQNRLNIPYCPIPKEMMFNVSGKQTFEKTPQVEILAKYLQENYELSAELLENLVDDFIFMIQTQNSLTDIMTSIGERIEFPNEAAIKEFVDLLVKVANYTRLWILKGYTPNELSPAQEKNTTPVTSEKIGRNEPCPCNSGKKYKKCCGSN
ncbi:MULTISPECIES: Rho termination factor N-terminal domain-containing protein [Bacillus]|uniref:Rho termination factor N-terminal domain-containing protein n=1 Tax=Bacillus TaxID=1386 RepID=UPI0002DDB3B3|nr:MULTISPECIES: Rho termination factor N-terminal domain-containing protein [Bacillus]